MSLAYFPLYPDDFEADTAHLTLAEDGAYNRLLRLCWRTPGCSVPSDRAWVYRRMRAHNEADQKVVETVIAEFFKDDGERLSNARLSKEWAAANEAHTRRKSAGAKGGKAKALKTNETEPSNATPMLKQPEPEPEPEPLETIAKAIVPHTVETPPKPEQPKRAPQPRSAARGNRIAPNWAPTAIDYAFAASEGLTREEINREADRFRDYWTAKSGREACKLDWSATWRNWVRSDFRKRAGSGSGNASRNGDRLGAFDKLAERLSGGSAGTDAGHHDEPGAGEGYVIDVTPTRLAG